MSRIVLADDSDQRCAHIFPEGHEKAGNRCGAFRTTISENCNFHSGGASEEAQRKSRKALMRKELSEKLSLDFHNLRTPQDVLNLYELVVNVAFSDKGFADTAKLMALMLPTVYKITKEIRAEAKGSGVFAMELGKDGLNLSAQFNTVAELDEFLKANESYSVQIMEQMHKTGQLTGKKGPPAITVKPESVDLDKQKLDIDGLARMSEKTAVPMTPKQTTGLFGRYLGDKQSKPARGFQYKGEVVGFEEIWEGELPEDAKPVLHDWYKYHEPTKIDPNIQVVRFRCKKCGKTARQRDDEVCFDPTEKL